MHKVLLYLWQLPQNFLALVILFLYKKSIECKERYKENITIYYIKGKGFGISLGNYIIFSDSSKEQIAQIDIQHEYGHCIQSQQSGPLYLFIFGLSSIILNIVCRLLLYTIGSASQFVRNYYKRWPEKQADILGGVFRE